MSLSRELIQNLYRSGDMRPTGEWIVCAAIGCASSAAHDAVHQPPDGQRFYVPLCEPCIESLLTKRLEYFVETHGFMGPAERDTEDER